MARRKQGQRDRVVSMLRAGPVTSEQFYGAHLPRFGARLFELRARGYGIVSERRPGRTTFVYTLTREPS